ncbi:hypothetical protein ACH5RR_039345 [Cinchona calisaya]|uniref:Uncharacterized protein n=1 Tax=Cinchona calisaya TaxID=153742 RepID=A0ABD2Y337_9GENT
MASANRTQRDCHPTKKPLSQWQINQKEAGPLGATTEHHPDPIRVQSMEEVQHHGQGNPTNKVAVDINSVAESPLTFSLTPQCGYTTPNEPGDSNFEFLS